MCIAPKALYTVRCKQNYKENPTIPREKSPHWEWKKPPAVLSSG